MHCIIYSIGKNKMGSLNHGIQENRYCEKTNKIKVVRQ